jgi:hypothetical protein
MEAMIDIGCEEEGNEDMCRARRAHESVIIGSDMFVFGGYCLRGYPDHELEFRRQQIFSYDTVSRKWTRHVTTAKTASDMPPPCTGAKSAALGRIIYSFGGLEVNFEHQIRQFSNATYALDTTTMTWRCCKANGDVKPSGRDKCSLCVDGFKLLIFGGWSVYIDKKVLQPGAVWVAEEGKIVGWNNELYLFDTETETWHSLETSGVRPSPRAAHTMNKVGHRVVIFGGRQPDRRMNDIHILNLTTLTWSGPILPTGATTELWPLPRSLHTMSLVAQSDNIARKLPIRLILLGGMDTEGDCCVDDAWILNMDELKWDKLSSQDKSVCRTWHTTCAIHSAGGYTELYTFGGSPDNIWKDHSRDLSGPVVFTFGTC